MTTVEFVQSLTRMVFEQAILPSIVVTVGLLLRKYLHVEITASQENAIKELARQGVAWAEEYARQKLTLYAEKTSGDEKLTIALNFVREMAKGQKLPEAKLGAAKLEKLIGAELSRARPAAAPAQVTNITNVRGLPKP